MRYTYVEENPESKLERKFRLALVVLYFAHTAFTAMPYMHGYTAEGKYATLSPVSLVFQPNGYNSAGEIINLIYGIVLIVLPMAAFFFCLLDKKSRIKYIPAAVCSVVTAAIITFYVGRTIAPFGVVTLILDVITLFLTMQGLQATNIRRREESLKK